MRKAQISLFIIIGLILVIVFGLISYKVVNSKNINLINEDKSTPIRNVGDQINLYVEDCLYETSVNSIYYIGFNGGYDVVPNKSLKTTQTNIPYYYYLGKDEMPTLEKIEEQISNKVEKSLFLCLYEFRQFREKNISLEIGELKANTEIGEQQVTVILDYPITAYDEEEKHTMREFQAEIPVRLGLIYNYAREINNELLKNEGIVNENTFSKFDVGYLIMPYDHRRTVYLFRDENENKKIPPFVYFFGAIRK